MADRFGGYGQAISTITTITASIPATMAAPIRQSGAGWIRVRAAPHSRHHS